MTPISVTWDNEAHTVIQFAVHRKCEWEAFWAAVQQVNTLMGEVPHTVDLIVNVSLGALPGLQVLQHFGRLYGEAPANHGLTLIVGSGVFHRMLVNIFSNVYVHMSDRVRIAESLANARVILADQQTTHPV